MFKLNRVATEWQRAGVVVVVTKEKEMDCQKWVCVCVHSRCTDKMEMKIKLPAVYHRLLVAVLSAVADAAGKCPDSVDLLLIIVFLIFSFPFPASCPSLPAIGVIESDVQTMATEWLLLLLLLLLQMMMMGTVLGSLAAGTSEISVTGRVPSDSLLPAHTHSLTAYHTTVRQWQLPRQWQCPINRPAAAWSQIYANRLSLTSLFFCYCCCCWLFQCVCVCVCVCCCLL